VTDDEATKDAAKDVASPQKHKKGKLTKGGIVKATSFEVENIDHRKEPVVTGSNVVEDKGKGVTVVAMESKKVDEARRKTGTIVTQLVPEMKIRATGGAENEGRRARSKGKDRRWNPMSNQEAGVHFNSCSPSPPCSYSTLQPTFKHQDSANASRAATHSCNTSKADLQPMQFQTSSPLSQLCGSSMMELPGSLQRVEHQVSPLCSTPAAYNSKAAAHVPQSTCSVSCSSMKKPMKHPIATHRQLNVAHLHCSSRATAG
ncbi:hypothetical protein Dimus_030267, partial [Dionaea muscipula]